MVSTTDSSAPVSPLTPGQVKLIKESWRILAPKLGLVAKQFYARLFDLDPGLEAFFSKIAMDQQGKKFTDTITIVVKGLDHFEMLVPAIGQLGSRHEGYGVKDEHYVVVKRALLGALGSNLGDRFAGGTQEAWSITYDALAEIMKKGQQEGPVTIPGIGS